MATKLDLVVGIATSGRREILIETLKVIAMQRRLPDRVVICPAQASDVDTEGLQALGYPTQVVLGGRGLTIQRNLIIANCNGADVIIFVDDDFLPDTGFIAEVEQLFAENHSIVLATGRVLADGIHSRGITLQEGHRILADSPSEEADMDPIRDVYCGYGCNMAVRMAPIIAHNIRFDERLPLYGWQEDADFSRQLAAFGRIVKYDRLQGVHLGAKGGRASGVKFGYSQVANPIYLVKKGTFGRIRAVKFISRNVVRNIIGSLWSEPWVDRRGRLKGNILAFRDLVGGSLDPARILSLG